ncbi:MAG: PAS domain-containing protein [Methylobacter sp.]
MPTDTLSPQSLFKPPNPNGILSIVLIYALFGAGWILLSDKWVQLVFSDPHQIILVSIVKGWLFVGMTSLLLYSLMQHWGGGVTATKIIPVGSRRLRASFLALATVIIVLTGAVIVHAFKHQKEGVLDRMQAVTEFKARQISDWLKDRQNDADFIQAGDFFSEPYRRWQKSGDRRSGERLQRQLQQWQKSRGFDAVLLLGPDFKTLWTTGSLALTPVPALQTAAQLAAVERKVQRVGPYLDAVGKPCLDFIIALTTMPGSTPVVVLHLDLINRLAPILQSRPLPGANDRTLLFQRNGGRLLWLNELKPPEAPATESDTPVDSERLFSTQLLRAEVSPGLIVEGLDARNIPVIGVVRAIPGTDWLLVTQQDLSAFYAETVDDVIWGGFVGLLALFIAGAGFYLFQQRQQLVQAQAIQQFQSERLRALHLLAAIADSSDDPIFAKDREGCYVLFNRAAGLLVGKSAEDMLGRNDRAIFPPEQAEMLMAIDRRVIDENRTITQEEELDTLQGKRSFLSTKGPLRDSDDNVIGIFGISRDITERKQAERALRDSESRFRALVEQSLAGIYIIQDGCFRYVNPGFAAIFGYDSPETLTDSVPVTDLVSPEDRERVAENVRRRIDAEVAYLHYSFTGLCRDGSRIEVEAHGRGFDYQGRPAIIGFILNITERKTAEAALLRQAQELAQRNSELERFNRATVGRELDMIALKQQVNELSRQLGQELPYSLAFLDAEPVAPQ